MLIGIQSSTGSRSGKDTVGELLYNELNKNNPVNHYLFALADALKESVNELFCYPDDVNCGNNKDKYGLILGVNTYDLVRYFSKLCEHYESNPDTKALAMSAQVIIDKFFKGRCLLFENVSTNKYWYYTSPRQLYQLFAEDIIKPLLGMDFWINFAPTNNCIITDIRFDKEINWLKENNGILIDVQRPNNPYTKDIPDHSSEKGLTGIKPDIIITNDGTISDLEKLVKDVYKTILS